jgi:trigger factor
VGEQNILQDALEDLGQEIYREALNQSGINPYGPGALQDMKTEPTLTFVYTVPLQPTVDLGDYRSVRVDYNLPEITADDVERSLHALQEQAAEATETDQPAQLGDRLLIDVHSFFVSEDDDHDDEADEDNDEHDETDEYGDHHEDDREHYIHQHDLPVTLKQGKLEPMGPGFTDHMIGVTVGELRQFTITYPQAGEEQEINAEVAGKTVEFNVKVKKVENLTLPELNDAFAAKFNEPDSLSDEPEATEAAVVEGETSLEAAPNAEAEVIAEVNETTPSFTLDDLRARIRKELEEEALENVNQSYSDQVLSDIVNLATIAYPEEMVQDQIDDMLKTLDQQLRQQGLSLEMYQRLLNKTRDDIAMDYRESAIRMLKRSLVLGELINVEQVRVEQADFEAHLARLAKQFNIPVEGIRGMFNNANIQNNTLNRLLQDKAFERLVAIGKGEAPELPLPTQTDDSQTETNPSES